MRKKEREGEIWFLCDPWSWWLRTCWECMQKKPLAIHPKWAALLWSMMLVKTILLLGPGNFSRGCARYSSWGCVPYPLSPLKSLYDAQNTAPKFQVWNYSGHFYRKCSKFPSPGPRQTCLLEGLADKTWLFSSWKSVGYHFLGYPTDRPIFQTFNTPKHGRNSNQNNPWTPKPWKLRF